MRPESPAQDPGALHGPPPSPHPPGVWMWYCVYCAGMALMYLAVIGLGIMFLTVEDFELEEFERLLYGYMFIVMGVVLMGAYVIAPFLPKNRGAWVYGIILIAFGLTSCCTMPASIPLLIFWLKPEAKAFFGHS